MSKLTDTFSFSFNPETKHIKGYSPGLITDTKNNLITQGYFPKSPVMTHILYNEYLASVKPNWVSSSYLTYGLFPITMAPSFIQSHINVFMVEHLNRHNIPVISLDPIPLLSRSTKIKEKELWVFRDVLDEFMGKKSYTVYDVIKQLTER